MLRRAWFIWPAVALGVIAGCGGGGGTGSGGGGGGDTMSTSSSSSGTGGTGGTPVVCGDGTVDATEACDDGNVTDGDGCAKDCTVEKGYTCTGLTSVCVTTCGDGVVAGDEKCDDSNTTTGDGCDDKCAIESGYDCTGEPSTCAAICGDGLVVGVEVCDDMNTTDLDGCAADCTAEAGWTCDTASPTICAPNYGDGKIVAGEECDDGNTADGDGCSASAKIEVGWYCTGEPSVCTTQCGDGIIAGAEACDDMNTADSDGCSAVCGIETGWTCSGSPSICATTCGDGIIAGVEVCDDNNTTSGDGCDAACAVVEAGWTCTGSPSACVTTCGDGIIAGKEVCDDTNTTAGDGCDATCAVETGWYCAGAPSVCATQCGDGIIAGAEKCDDKNTTAGDGCNATCGLEAGWVCNGSPSVCNTVCGDGVIAGTEVCDDTNASSGDGCSATCTIETGFNCTGSPSICTTTCGDGIPAGSETCDDGNTIPGDGCDASCQAENGYACSGAPSVCGPVCGDGQKIAGEKCDDGNLTNGDCCSSTCQVEAGCEIEGNDTFATANDFASLSVGSKIKGLINPTSDKDTYLVVVPPGSIGTITAQTLDGPLGTTCVSNKIDSYITIFDANGTNLVGDDDSGDGYCSLATKSGLIPGNYFVEVKKSSLASATATFDYLLQIQVFLATCGNGITETGEQCDDGNTVSNDGCSAICKLEAQPEAEPNNACGATTSNGPYTLPPNVLISGSINPIGEQDWYRIVLTNFSDVRIETFDDTGPGSCATTTDTKIQLYNSSCAAIGTLSDDEGINYCSLLDPTVTTNSFMKHLAPGTYYLQVLPYSSTTAAFNYTVLVSLTAFCGNGIVEGSEQCDGSANCQADCNFIPVCGDGIKQAAEQCDDGNTVSGDGCSATCILEGTTEVEPNGTTAQADTALPAITGTTRIIGSIGAASEVDIFKVTVATQQVVRFEIFDSSAADCVGMNAMQLKLLNSSGTLLKQDSPSSDFTIYSGISNCPALVVNLDPGTYYIQANQTSTLTVPFYALEARFLTDNGTETEQNGTIATANAEAGTGFFVCADHQTTTDLDIYAVTVPQGKSIRTEVVEVGTTATGYETCESNGMDSHLTLFNAAGTSLVTDDDGGRGYCSAIDGTGTVPQYTAAHNLAAGTYYIQVKASSLATTAQGTFNYCLSVTIR
ncbi:MAG: DVUA0089 family protein [Minicystis sp.]